ncbi:MAG: hypothetical protein AB7Q00_01520 [Phycisphaerales bacterium]
MSEKPAACAAGFFVVDGADVMCGTGRAIALIVVRASKVVV